VYKKQQQQNWIVQIARDVVPTSPFSLDPRGKAQQQQTAKLFTVEKGIALIKVPGALKQLKLLPYQTIED
jgi:hypothetical protein